MRDIDIDMEVVAIPGRADLLCLPMFATVWTVPALGVDSDFGFLYPTFIDSIQWLVYIVLYSTSSTAAIHLRPYSNLYSPGSQARHGALLASSRRLP